MELIGRLVIVAAAIGFIAFLLIAVVGRIAGGLASVTPFIT